MVSKTMKKMNMNETFEKLQNVQTEIDTLTYLLEMESVNLELNNMQRSVIVGFLCEKVKVMGQLIKQL